jgi:hypothetical protein
MKNKKYLTKKWHEIERIYNLSTKNTNVYGNNFHIEGELDTLIDYFLVYLSKLTLKYGYDYTVEGVHLDIWKRRIWTLTENAGLLPPFVEDEI